ncbi:MAG: SlyX family protein [Alphaproteobacteria bacterium]|nr:SlyX family protein [Alphaproteobacteria bacterium]
MEKDIQTLQELVAHQQEDISRLSDELYIQQQEIVKLQTLVKAVQKQLEQALAEAAVGAGGDNSPEPPPPHY